ncbi:phosphatase PAP2 family protein [Methanothermococcus sp.]|uniref:phosphatase PAP2 family protein n=1 Tax=Methanothermococcus sp. TaxID=2614238 RepID=UPI0025E5AE5D|nr:phosphatase PAP2 family protein [Methanothermococcus sp.]
MKKKFAEYISYIFPFLLIITLIIAIHDIFKLIALAIIPCIVWLASAKLKGQNWDIEDKNCRIIPLILLAVYGVIICFVFNDFFSKVFLVNIIFILIITLFWKISMHCYGLSTLIMILLYLLKYSNNHYLLLLLTYCYIVFLILTMWSRLYLKKHTLLQVILGMLFGFLINFLINFYIC